MSTRSEAAATEQSRVLRVFVSSTFRDMHAEREVLVKEVFPQVRKLCEQRGVSWAEVDLRWGVTDEQKSEGKVLSICLDEIRKCRPFFLGLLGERYGWVPEQIAPDTISREPWLARYEGRSVTELEIIHGVLRDREMAARAFFYLRDPGYLARLPRSARPADYASEGEESARKLGRLKDEIRSSGFPVVDGYRDPEELARRVLADLTAVVDRLYPAGSAPGPLDREDDAHRAFARSRANVYIGRPSYYRALDEHVDGRAPALVVRGESGSGKSALLANWGLRREPSRDELVLLHFVGASPESAAVPTMLQRIVSELKRRLDLPRALPGRPELIREEFGEWLALAAERRKVVLIIDGLNQLEDRDGAHELGWLPVQIPANVRLIVSTLSGRPLEELIRRGWSSLDVQPLAPDERATLVGDFLAQYAKALEPARVARIVEAEATSSPLYLRALLEELRQFGVHERLDERLGHYLSAKTLQELFDRILARFEADYEADRPGLVRDAMTSLWAARRGLGESELLELLGKDGTPLPRAHWVPLALAAEVFLVDRSGLLGFSHDYIREAVRTRYLRRASRVRAGHRRLADYFEVRGLGRRKTRGRLGLPWIASLAAYAAFLGGLLSILYSTVDVRMTGTWFWFIFTPVFLACPFIAAALSALVVRVVTGVLQKTGAIAGGILDRARPSETNALGPLFGQRVLDELPWQLARAGAWWRVHDLFAFLPFFQKAWDANPLQCAALWSQVESGTLGIWGRRLSRTDVLRDILRAALAGRAVDAYRRVLRTPARYADFVPAVAQLLAELGHHRESLNLLNSQSAFAGRATETAGIIGVLEQHAEILVSQRLDVAATTVLRQAESLSRSSGRRRDIARCLIGLADIDERNGSLDAAIARLAEAEEICRAEDDEYGMSLSQLVAARIARDRGETDQARGLLLQAERLFRRQSRKPELLRALRERNQLATMMGDEAEADEVARQAIQIRYELGIDAGSPWEAEDDGAETKLRALRAKERDYRAAGDRALLAPCLAEEAMLIGVQERFPLGALPILQEAKRLAGRTGQFALADELTPLERQLEDGARAGRGDELRASRARYLRPAFGAVLLGWSAAALIWLSWGADPRMLLILFGLVIVPLAAWSARCVQALFASPYMILTPMGIAIRHWRANTEELSASSLLRLMVIPRLRVEHIAITWADYCSCYTDPGFRWLGRLTILARSGDYPVGNVFHKSSRSIADQIQRYAEVAKTKGVAEKPG